MSTYPIMKFYTVYKTTNLVNGKWYVGCHMTFNPYDDYLGSGVAFLLAVKKYGRASFQKVLLSCHTNRDDMLESERFHVNHLDPDSYNLREGGSHCPSEPLLGRNHTLEAIEKIREAGRNKVFNDEYRRNLSIAATGRKHTQATKDTLSAMNAGNNPSEETRQKLSGSNMGHEVLPETRQKISATLMGHEVLPVTREKIRVKALGRKPSADTRDKRSKTMIRVLQEKRDREALLSDGGYTTT